jgi:hypothetical protein
MAWLPKLKSGGIIAGHDYQFEPVRRAVAELLGSRNIETFDDNSWLIRMNQSLTA